MTCDLDRELRAGVAVDVALDDGEVAVGADSKDTASWPARGERRSGDRW